MTRPALFISILGALLYGTNHVVYGLPTGDTSQTPFSVRPAKDTTVLILGGGVAGITAARTLHDKGITDFIIVEARHELGGRMMNHRFGAAGHEYNVEVGANWVQGTSTSGGPTNPIWTLAKKHNITTQKSHFFESLSRCRVSYSAKNS